MILQSYCKSSDTVPGARHASCGSDGTCSREARQRSCAANMSFFHEHRIFEKLSIFVKFGSYQPSKNARIERLANRIVRTTNKR